MNKGRTTPLWIGRQSGSGVKYRMLNKTRRTPRSTVIGLTVIFATLPLPAAPASEPTELPESFLAFETQIDGKCHNLSEGGKLQVLRNSHPTQKLRFRLIRYFVDVRQRGRATGTAEPAGEGVALGCTRVGGRTQRWVIERAEFETGNDQ